MQVPENPNPVWLLSPFQWEADTNTIEFLSSFSLPELRHLEKNN